MTVVRKPSSAIEILTAYNRVSRFEGLTVKQFASRLPSTIPSVLRTKVLQKLAKIVSSDTVSGTSPKKIDQWSEALQVARLVKQRLNGYLNRPMQKYDTSIYTHSNVVTKYRTKFVAF